MVIRPLHKLWSWLWQPIIIQANFDMCIKELVLNMKIIRGTLKLSTSRRAIHEHSLNGLLRGETQMIIQHIRFWMLAICLTNGQEPLLNNTVFQAPFAWQKIFHFTVSYLYCLATHMKNVLNSGLSNTTNWSEHSVFHSSRRYTWIQQTRTT